jgi:tRNA 5-methylaminomethyl-2-thiouridine biosynthesis bifunctional protein
MRSSSPELTWSGEGGPRSQRFDDIYFNADGLAESRAVFLAGCGLPEAWAARRRFTVGELGFGTGLNVLALLELWRRTHPSGGRLHIFSVEAYPLSQADARRALALFPDVAELAAELLAQWPRARQGWHRIDLPGLGVVIDVAAAEALEALREWSGAADAWFLDGFAPSKNPEIWRDEVLDLVAARSAPGARLATFTVAGAVRRGLAERGFEVRRAPGHGRKRERLEAMLPGRRPEASPQRVAIVGAGIAGASLARAFRAQGVEPVVYDPAPGSGASGNPAALVSPRLDVSEGPAACLYAQAWTRASDLYAKEAPASVVAMEALRLTRRPKDASRFEILAASPIFRDGALELLAPAAASIRLGEASAEGALLIRRAVTVTPAQVLHAWTGTTRASFISEVRPSDGGWLLIEEGGGVVGEADIVCLAPGDGLNALAREELVQPVRGQATWSGPLEEEVAAATWGCYAIPTAEGGVLFGATHDRGSADRELRPEDEARNVSALAERRPELARFARETELASRASVRAATRDRMPLAGELQPGLFVLGGLGGRGFTTAPLLAEHVAGLALGLPSPLPHSLGAAVAPGRFA